MYLLLKNMPPLFWLEHLNLYSVSSYGVPWTQAVATERERKFLNVPMYCV